MNIGILGGGIGGLSAAIALKQQGFAVDVYERHSEPTEIGAGIVCWPNASFVLEQLGVLSHVAKVSGSLNKMNRFSSKGDAIGSLDINKLSQLMGYPSYSIIRKDLMSILTLRSLELGINIHYQHNVTSISNIEVTNTKTRAQVHFSNEKSISPDIIIGADGRMNSLARKLGNNRRNIAFVCCLRMLCLNTMGFFPKEVLNSPWKKLTPTVCRNLPPGRRNT